MGLVTLAMNTLDTRHNTGFMVLDAFAKASNIHFEDKRYGFVAETTHQGKKDYPAEAYHLHEPEW